MSLPTTVTFAVGDTAYIAAFNQLVADINALYTSFLTTQAGAFFTGTSPTTITWSAGARSFVLNEASQRAWAIGTPIRVVDVAAPTTKYADGSVTAYTHPNVTVTIGTPVGTTPSQSWSLALTGVSGTVPVASGGTGATDAATARTNLGCGTAATQATGAFATAAQGTTADAALPKAGGTMSGAVAHGNNNITGLKLISFTAEYDNGNSGASKTIDFANGACQKVTLDQNTTLTITTPAAAGHYQLRVIQDGTGSRTVTWAGSAYASTRWGGSVSAPSLNTSAAGVSIVNFWYDGTNLYQTLFRVGMA